MVNDPELNYLLYSATDQMVAGPFQIFNYMLPPLLFMHCQPDLNQMCQTHGGLLKNILFLHTI